MTDAARAKHKGGYEPPPHTLTPKRLRELRVTAEREVYVNGHFFDKDGATNLELLDLLDSATQTAALRARLVTVRDEICYGCAEDWAIDDQSEMHTVPEDERLDSSVWYSVCRAFLLRSLLADAGPQHDGKTT